MPGAGGANGLAGAVVLGEQGDAFVFALDAGGELGAVLAGEPNGVRGGELFGLDVPAAGDAMDVLVVMGGGRGFLGCEGFSLALGESLFAFHGAWP